MLEVTRYFLYYTIYSFFGYICEVVYVALCTKKITNRGYLYGPLVPIYGYGAIGMILCLSWTYNISGWYMPIVVFILGFVLTSALEYLTSYFMELIFHMRWWDYSNKIGNINGRVCLRNSTMFGVLVVLVIYVIHPYVVVNVVDWLASFGNVWFYVVAALLFVGEIVDTAFSTIKHVSISKIIRKLESMARTAEETIKNGIVEAEENVKNKVNELKLYLEDTRVVKKLSSIDLHYPSMKIKSATLKAKLSLTEFMDKIKAKTKGE